MTIRDIALATALTTTTALAAPAALAQDSAERIDDPDTENIVENLPEAEVDLTEITGDVDIEASSPSELDLMNKQLTEAEKTLVDNILAEAEMGATLSSVDDYVIGEVNGTMGNEGSDHLVYVDVREGADIAADRLAFRASALSVEQVGDLEYAMTLGDLRRNVAERVATQAM